MIRAATELDAGRLGGILSDHFARTDWLPSVNTKAKVIHYCGHMISNGWVHVHEDHRINGFIAVRKNNVLALYVDLSDQRRGIARSLVEFLQTQKTSLSAWVHQYNTAACAFYASLGFNPLATSNGDHNDEGLPDIHYRWESSPS